MALLDVAAEAGIPALEFQHDPSAGRRWAKLPPAGGDPVSQWNSVPSECQCWNPSSKTVPSGRTYITLQNPTIPSTESSRSAISRGEPRPNSPVPRHDIGWTAPALNPGRFG